MKPILTIMAALFCGAAGVNAAHPTDVIKTRDGGDLKITFFGHASLAFEYDGKHIYVDPVSEYADYASLPAAAVIVVTHDHGDHLDPSAVEALADYETTGFTTQALVDEFGYGEALAHGEKRSLSFMEIEAVPAYNTSHEKLNFHPAASKHNGYIFTFGGTRVYVAGDTEDTPELMALRGVDIAFLPVNLPYTMTEEQAARAVKAIKPTIFYPYHYGGTNHKTDLGKLERLLEGSGVEVRIRPME